ncbi:SPOR domain-containing protein [Pseudoalteromonas sp. J010]|uniref:SPOR domain-containing protein n=1 Tax=Pseudoalteromonas sp. J010 TaxID=998465 RepID=UPI000F64A97C|nr:SPOR domain-containing protein [Pseudoalteromonas sp. J010]RRS08769.1 SPOR domain-containing protein [Pseudoalteromonas sp. J010]
MAQHDYINKKPKGKGKTKPEKTTKFPVVATIAALLLIGGFAYGLWFIKTNADPKEVEQAKNPHPAQEQTVVKPKPRPPEFIEEIKNHEITVEVKEIESKGPYQMQCGSFKTHAQAEAMKAKVAFAGLIAEIRRTEGSNGVWYRVRLGPYDTKRLAESDKNKLQRVGIFGCGIWGWT